MNRQIVKRGKLTYYLSDTSIVVDVGGYQFISYNVYNSPNRSGLSEFKRVLLASKDTEYGNVVDQMDLAQKCKLIGTGTTKPDWGEE